MNRVWGPYAPYGRKTIKLHEYQARELLLQYGIAVPQGVLARTACEAAAAAALWEGNAVIKAQVLTGGRGKAGAIRVVSSREEAESAAREILAMSVKGFPVRAVLVTERLDIRSEYYAGITIDRETKAVVLILSAAGGIDIEEIAAREPQRIHQFILSPGNSTNNRVASSSEAWRWLPTSDEEPSPSPAALTMPPASVSSRGLSFADHPAGLTQWLSGLFPERALLEQAVPMVLSMHKLFHEKDCSLVEINPLAVCSVPVRASEEVSSLKFEVSSGDPALRTSNFTLQTPKSRLVAADAKVVFDDNGLFRHPDLAALRNPEEYTDDESEAKEAGLSYVSLSGEIGCMVNGAGLAMATMDGIKLAGGSPANFLDVGGSSNPQKVLDAMRILLRNGDLKAILVNIFGGITRCDDIAQGILMAKDKLKIGVPMVIRLIGTNEEQGRDMLEKAGMIVARRMTDAIEDVVRCARGEVRA